MMCKQLIFCVNAAIRLPMSVMLLFLDFKNKKNICTRQKPKVYRKFNGEESCYSSVNFGTKRPNCVGPDRYLIWPFLLPISLKFYRLFQGEQADRSTYNYVAT
jgi:hypothetical protein